MHSEWIYPVTLDILVCINALCNCSCYLYIVARCRFRVIPGYIGSLVANLIDVHFMSSSSSEGNITNLSFNKVIVLISYRLLKF